MIPLYKIIWIGFSSYYFELQKNLPSKYSIIFEKDCSTAHQIILKEQPDLIIGYTNEKPLFEFCQSKRIKFNTIPFIYLTSDTSLYNKLKVLETGVDAYINYPITIAELMVRINTLVTRTKPLELRTDLPTFLVLINKEIDKNISDPNFTSNQLAKKLSLSRSQFYKNIKKHSGDYPSSYLRRYRLQKAKKLIEQNFDSISQISLQVGFNNLTYFSTQFKKLFGLSPSSVLSVKHILN